MKIKDIKQYRTYYKSTRPVDKKLEEHFIGNFYDDLKSNTRKYGWFNLYHGDKDGFSTAREGIANFLQSFLDMAKDGQAVYEFLQNAVDAGSTHYTMVWGEDEIDGNKYLLVANNGEMFDFNSMRSILNVGSSTKTSQSANIGKFGIGFKLAHRLVGKDNGLDELLSNDPSGPVLFSWKNYELHDLAKGSDPQPSNIEFKEENNNYTITNDDPWLLKILLTCFPTAPANGTTDNEVKLLGGKHPATPLFSKKEYLTLSRWVSKYSDILNKEKYKEGSLFFIKLGKGKESDLADKNLAEGVKFSLAILQETAENKENRDTILETVQLNREKPITRPNLNYLNFKITKKNDLNDYTYIRFGEHNFESLSQEQKNRINREDNIEVMFGFRNYNKIDNYFKGAPNFYLYFPLSEEVHNFNFILHSNAFYKASSRTFLHKGTTGEEGINERLLRIIARRIGNELTGYYNNKNDKNNFLHLYAALLTSKESNNNDRQWIKEPFIDELTKSLKKLIPVRYSFENSEFELMEGSENIFIKDTAINIKPDEWELENINWFYWGDSSDFNIKNSAIEKLNIKSFDIFKLLDVKDAFIKINQWLEEDRNRVHTVLNELNILSDRNKVTENFKYNLTRIKLFEFTDGKFLSINELTEIQEKGYLILHRIASIKNELEKCGLITTIINLDNYNFFDNFNSYLSADSQLRNQQKIIKIFSSKITKEISDHLTSEERLKIFRVFRNMIEEGKRKERLQELKLFKNQSGEPVYIKNLLLSTSINWLTPFTISKKERNADLDRYLLSKDEDIYEGIIYPFWNEIAYFIIKNNDDKLFSVFDDIITYYKKSDHADLEDLYLSEKNLMFFKGGIVVVEHPYYSELLEKISDDIYNSVQEVVDQYLNIQIPDKLFLKYIGEVPFYIVDNGDPLVFEKLDVKKQDIENLLLFCTTCNISILEYATIFKEENNDFSFIADSEIKNFDTNNSKIINYISKYHSGFLLKFPDELVQFNDLIQYHSDKLSKLLINRTHHVEKEKLVELTDALVNENINILKDLLNKHIKIEFDTERINNSQNEICLKFINRLLQDDEDHLDDLHKKIVLTSNKNKVTLSSLDVANDTILLKNNDTNIKLSRTQILELDDTAGIKLINDFYQQIISKELLSESDAKKLFKISETGVTVELIERFKKNTDSHINNIHQLALVLLSNKIDKTNINNYNVFASDEKVYSLSDNYILPHIKNEGYFNKQYQLSKKYLGIQELLQLNDLEVLNYNPKDSEENDINYIIPGFLFQRGCSLDIFDPDFNNLELFKYLYRCWKNTPVEKRINKKNEDWNEILKFEPKSKIYSDLILSEESLDTDITDWLTKNKTEKDRFLNAIGIQTANSDIIVLRNWFFSTTLETPQLNIETIPLNYLSNTLVGLAEGFKEKKETLFSFYANDEKSKIINRLIQRILEDSSKGLELRVPVHIELDVLKLGSEQNVWPKYINNETYLLLIGQCEKDRLIGLFKKVDIIYRNDIYNEFIEKTYEELIFDFNFVDQEFSEEHDEPFYFSWSKEKNIKLIKKEKILYQTSVTLDDTSTIELGIINKDLFYFDEDSDENYTSLYYDKKIRLEELSVLLEEEGHDGTSESLNELIKTRDKILASFYYAISNSGKNSFDDEVAKLLSDSLKKQSIEDERKDIIEEIHEENKYTFKWFESYIKYLLSFENISETTTQKSISFQQVKTYSINEEVSKKYFMLKGANSLIPLNIEAFENFSVSLIFKNKQKEKINVEGVSKKGQDLLIYIPNGLKSKITDNFTNVINIKIHFSPVLDLIKRLYDAFTNEKIITPWDDIKESTPPVHFIYGPPGTGKTTKLCNLFETEYNSNPFLKVLVLVPTNKAGDVIAKKLLIDNSSLSIVRIGNATDPELEYLDEEIYQSSLDHNHLDSCNIVISTIHRLPYYRINYEGGVNYRLFDSIIQWDYIVFDEASMINLPYITFSLFALNKDNPEAKIIIAGDPKQIPPVVDSTDNDLEELNMEDENIYKMFEINSFIKEEQILRSIDSIENLTTQYRSVEKIGNLFSEFAYNNLLSHGRNLETTPVKNLPGEFIKDLNKPIALIDFPIDVDNSILRPAKLLYSSYHVQAAILTAELIKYFDDKNKENKQYTIGIISPYKAQSLIMNKLITSYDISDNLNIHCDTVHGFQGDECDIIIFVVNPNQIYHTGHKKALLSKEYIYNVAISRAKDYLWILNPFSDIQNNPFINNLKEIIGIKDSNLIQSQTIEKIIFNEEDFIVNHSFLTGHDNINVFGQVEMKYFIKANTTAIDIQLRK